MTALEISKELDRLEAYIRKMETVPINYGQRLCMTKITESWHKRLWNEQMKRMNR